MIKKIFLLFFCALSFNNLNAQSKTDIESIFKMQLFLNRKNVQFRTMDSSIVKNDSLYKVFEEVTNLKIDTLKLENKITGDFEEEFQFFKLSIDEIRNNRKLINDEFQYIGFGSGMCDFYILALNRKTGISYRLSGFDVNDFFGFLSDFKVSYFNSTGKKLKTSKFIKNYKVENLDFECLYKGLKIDGIDRKKYPCLMRCSDRIKMH